MSQQRCMFNCICMYTFCRLAGQGHDYNNHEKAGRQGDDGVCPIAVVCHQESLRERMFAITDLLLLFRQDKMESYLAPACASMCRCLYRGNLARQPSHPHTSASSIQISRYIQILPCSTTLQLIIQISKFTCFYICAPSPSIF